MATTPQLTGEGFNSIAGMSKSQLYDLMSRLKLLIEQNQQQAKQILVDNPMLTRALFQAQILLGMVQPTQPANIQKVLSQPQMHVQQQSIVQPTQSLPVQPTQSMPVQPCHLPQTSPSQPLILAQQKHLSQNISLHPLNFQSQTMPSVPPHSAQQSKGPANVQFPSMSAPPSSHKNNLHLHPPSAPSRYSAHQNHMPTISNQAQPSLQMSGMFNQPCQPSLPQHPMLPSKQPFPHQHNSQMPHDLGLQQMGAPQQHFAQSMFHSGSNLASSFQQGQPPLPSQPPPQHLYQGGPHNGSEFNNQFGTSGHAERVGSHWAPSLPERIVGGTLFPRPPLTMPGLRGGQQPHPPPLTPEMERVLVQQVMNLTSEQINLLPPEQRQQVIQLQLMLR